MFYSARNLDFRDPRSTEHDIFCIIDDNSLKTRVIPSKLVSIDIILWSLQAKHKNMCVSMSNNDLFSKKRRFSWTSQTDHDILDMIDDISLKTRVITPKLVSIDSIRWSLQAKQKNMFVSYRNEGLFLKKRRFVLFAIWTRCFG